LQITPAELVRVVHYLPVGCYLEIQAQISDQTAQLRIDADVNDLVGFAQPETCSELLVLWEITNSSCLE
jgi:hypothetical protein